MATVSESKIAVEDIRRALVESSFEDFLTHVFIEQERAGAVPFQKWPHLVKLAIILPKQRLLTWLKARQIGCTWLVACYVLWRAMYFPSEVILLLSKREDDAKVFLAKCVFIYNNLPPWLRAGMSSTTEKMTFDSGSRITAMPSGPDVGRSETASIVVVDEADHQPYLDQNFAALKPTIDAGGQMLLLGTSSALKIDSRFKSLHRSGVLLDIDNPEFPEDGDWARVFLAWHVRPDRPADFKEKERERGAYSEFELEKEYPDTEEEALAPARSRMYFNRDALGRMLVDLREPIDVRGGVVKIWRPPAVGQNYVGFGDFAWGETMAYDCATIMDYNTAEVVAEIHGRLEDEEMADLFVELCKEYRWAYCSGEANSEGLTVINIMVRLGYGNRMWHHGKDWLHNEHHRGWLTTGLTRPPMLGEYAKAVRERQVIEHCRDAVNEMFSFIRHDSGKAAKAVGAFDDHVMSRAGAWRMREDAFFVSGPGGAVTPMPANY